jgi:hypothetical protein
MGVLVEIAYHGAWVFDFMKFVGLQYESPYKILSLYPTKPPEHLSVPEAVEPAPNL